MRALVFACCAISAGCSFGMESLSGNDLPTTSASSPGGREERSPAAPSELSPTNPETTSTATLASNVTAAIAYGLSVEGTKYAPWTGGPLQPSAPMWTAAEPAPSPFAVKAQSANAAGLVNLMLRAIGKPLPSDPAAGTGGTGAYGRYYAKVAKPFDANVPWPEGTLIGRKYRDIGDQGHVAVVLANGKLLQSFAMSAGATTPGVNAKYTIADAVGVYTFEYAVLPQDWLAP
jgi:hypothetical protein